MTKVSTLKFGDLYMCNSAWNEDTYIELLDDSENTVTCKARHAEEPEFIPDEPADEYDCEPEYYEYEHYNDYLWNM